MVERSKPDPLQPEHLRPDEIHFMDYGPAHFRLVMRSPAWRPPTDVYETEDAIVVRVEIAGMQDEDFSIELDERILAIRGVRPLPGDPPERRAYHQMEIRFGEFSSEVELPTAVLAAEVKADYENGFLRVVLPKLRPRQIQIKE
jgi:HSP20 family protein